MKKLMSGLFILMAVSAFADKFDKEETIIKGKLYEKFPVLEVNKNIVVDEIGIDIERDGVIEVEVEFARGSETNQANYKAYADKIADTVNAILQETNNSNLVLKKIELDTDGIHDDDKIFRY